ncbi:peptidase U35 [Brucella anthropi]|uniref:prohead protease/major capsid protein fusion protein n=1 Tax=Brucella anthropi TaxID=529 RepID=UPI00124D4673|nr:prohead protease/major capsid protein fusion protein [Brucella anthropi]KAB2738459.1 peptidase U35 [Brucella anthropi]
MTDKTLTRSAVIAAGSSTLDVAARTVEVCWTSGASVKRYSWDDGYYMEELEVSPKAIRMDRFASMSLLDGHEQSMTARLGTVVAGSIRIEGGKAYATIKFSRHENADRILKDLEDGHPLSISVGYRVHKSEKTEGERGQLPTLRAIDWEPLELSAVAVPADPAATSRSEGIDPMPDPIENAEQRHQRPAPTNIINERRRVSDLRYLARSANIEDTELDRAIEEGTTVDAFRNYVFDKMVERQNQSPTFPVVATRGMGDGMNRTDAMISALLARVDPSHKVEGEARQYVGLPVSEIARRCLENRGENVIGLSQGGLIGRALHTTSDFPAILAGVAQTSMMQAYNAAPAALKQVARQSTAVDFRAKTTVKLSEGPGLEKVNEHGEYKRGTFTESAESYKIATYGKVFGATRQLLINDQLGAFVEIATKLGRASEAFEASFLASLVESNPKMGDNKALFHADHKNLAAAGSSLSVTSLSGARLAMRRQTGLAGEIISVTPRFLIVPSELETLAEQVLADIAAAKVEDTNPFSKSLTLIVEPRLTDAKAWYVAASPAEIEGLEYSYLAGEPGPQIEDKQGFNVDGIEWKVRLDYGAAFLEHRGWYKNPGE